MINFVPGQPEQFHDIEDLFFLYGSNMHPQQLARRCYGAQMLCAARLDHYRLAFYGYTEEWDGALETVEPCDGSTVWGALMKIHSLECERLDQWMDARMDGGGMYFHSPVEVTSINGERHCCRLYRKDVCDTPALPSSEYLQHILTGAAYRNLPAPYLDQIRTYASKPASYPVPIRCGGDLGAGAGASCKDCATAAPIPVQESPLCVLQSI